ncbi:hypothetical protein JWJ90_06080 [Desulfobulbus rhabdoformis]|uniref:DUF6506 family protein n=1 Tax=Desulfobulbus rhabdoformis TaxID=34032 RepID=UPI001964782A|nr:DUF6506 family protein [Desulfobulbus rhabdoformis]MBM9613855.1 hypothetical protein [Desulfobulbus rhabdoformis]
MAEIVKAAFVFIAPEADPKTHRQWIETPVIHLLSIGVGSYTEAVDICRDIVEQEGVKAIELCAGFGNKGVAMIAEAVGKDIAVGVVRFDIHPALGNVSGDTIF